MTRPDLLGKKSIRFVLLFFTWNWPVGRTEFSYGAWPSLLVFFSLDQVPGQHRVETRGENTDIKARNQFRPRPTWFRVCRGMRAEVGGRVFVSLVSPALERKNQADEAVRRPGKEEKFDTHSAARKQSIGRKWPDVRPVSDSRLTRWILSIHWWKSEIGPQRSPGRPTATPPQPSSLFFFFKSARCRNAKTTPSILFETGQTQLPWSVAAVINFSDEMRARGANRWSWSCSSDRSNSFYPLTPNR